ncbi:carboxypeptidase-like regulatory domain-containing protein [uncultured Methanobrevibacter sp.]|uniref:carboxypeptidase-like regulatory domain-containing protein n=1 Tax=uncultured Methanobrevibacter sp. TaxID=253161 RepID=UPI00320A3AC5
MESKNIIIILIVIIVILAAAIGFMVLKPMHAKEPTKIKVDSNKTLYEGENLSVKLTDLNKTPLSKQKVNITVKNSKGKVVANKTVKTNDKGKAKLDLNLKKGKYDVSVSYDGNENYTGNNTTQKLTIKEKKEQTANTQSGSSSTYYNGMDLSGGSGESVEIEQVHEESGVVEGYKGGRKGVWTPSGNFIEEGGGY